MYYCHILWAINNGKFFQYTCSLLRLNVLGLLWINEFFLHLTWHEALSCKATKYTEMVIYIMPLEIQVLRGESWGPINQFNPAMFLWLFQSRTWIPNVIHCDLFCVQWVRLQWEVIVSFVDIGGIHDHHCLNFLFIMVSYILILRRFKDTIHYLFPLKTHFVLYI